MFRKGVAAGRTSPASSSVVVSLGFGVLGYREALKAPGGAGVRRCA